MEEPSPQSRQEDIDRCRAKFIAKGGVIEIVETKTSSEIIDGLKPRFEVKTIESWVAGDINRLKKRKEK